MNAKELADKLQDMTKEYQDKFEDKTQDRWDRMFNAGFATACIMIRKELLEAIDKGDIR